MRHPGIPSDRTGRYAPGSRVYLFSSILLGVEIPVHLGKIIRVDHRKHRGRVGQRSGDSLGHFDAGDHGTDRQCSGVDAVLSELTMERIHIVAGRRHDRSDTTEMRNENVSSSSTAVMVRRVDTTTTARVPR